VVLRDGLAAFRAEQNEAARTSLLPLAVVK
jgi:hypothetical protein